MCIRDRLLEGHVDMSQLPGMFPILIHVPPASSLLKQPWSCLLYTSDAADERSSVDLGGRRIIKKKTK